MAIREGSSSRRRAPRAAQSIVFHQIPVSTFIIFFSSPPQFTLHLLCCCNIKEVVDVGG
jgi:hypothetical protein